MLFVLNASWCVYHSSRLTRKEVGWYKSYIFKAYHYAKHAWSETHGRPELFAWGALRWGGRASERAPPARWSFLRSNRPLSSSPEQPVTGKCIWIYNHTHPSACGGRRQPRKLIHRALIITFSPVAAAERALIVAAATAVRFFYCSWESRRARERACERNECAGVESKEPSWIRKSWLSLLNAQLTLGIAGKKEGEKLTNIHSLVFCHEIWPTSCCHFRVKYLRLVREWKQPGMRKLKI